MLSRDVVIVGGGLAGLCAALSVKPGLSVVLMDKCEKLGGNSAKASSGMNATPTLPQASFYGGVSPDSVECFAHDTLLSGDGLCNPELVELLASNSRSANEFLRRFGVDLNVLSKCGGHSFARTHRHTTLADAPPINVGYFIIKSLIAACESKGVELLSSSKVTGLKIDESGAVCQVEYSSNTQDKLSILVSKGVILCTGGYGASRGANGFLTAYGLDSIPSTNGPWATGDGIKLATAIGADTVQMDKIQIHPTAFVDPNEPECFTKFLAGEMLRGYGGILVNSRGERFVDEMERRDHVTAAINMHCENSKAYLILNTSSKEQVGPAFSFYLLKGFFKSYRDSIAFCLESGLPSNAFQSTLGSSSISPFEEIWVAMITPALHYTMGGLKFDSHARVCSRNGDHIPGLFAAGEVTGGLHGQNRLGGNSLLECVIFGRIAGESVSI